MTNVSDRVEQPKILLLVDDEQVRDSLKTSLMLDQFQVTTAANVAEALYLIDTEPFNILLIDLHRHRAADGFTVVSAMRHSHPDSVMLMFSGYPASQEAVNAILSKAAEVVPKSMRCSHFSRFVAVAD